MKEVKITYLYPKYGLNGGWTTVTISVSKNEVDMILRTIHNEGYILKEIVEM